MGFPLIYQGAGMVPLRKILAPFNSDPDWADPSVTEPDSVDPGPGGQHVTWITSGYGPVLPSRVGLAFSFMAGLTRLTGGTATLSEFVVVSKESLNAAEGAVVVNETVVGASLGIIWTMSNLGAIPHGIRLSTIAAPAGATVLAIGLMELPKR